MNVLLLEDDPDAREALAALLSLDAHTVAQADDVASFLLATRDLQTQAVIFDLHLACEATGLKLALDYQARRQAAGLGPARLIALSGHADARHVIAGSGAAATVDYCFVKPADPTDILAALGG
ncbi:MAG: response regulator [Nevskia sp.]|nr:response regulator [Nevskia sp.]